MNFRYNSFMSSQSTQSPSAASTLPYDILREIFLYCTPDSPLDEVQPNLEIAPMSLCHVCSSWRTTALEIPPLWSHLYYKLPIRWEHGLAITWNMKALRRDIEFLTWWRENHGSIAPFIRLKSYKQKKDTRYEEAFLTGLKADPGPMAFLIGYLSSAQYLDIGVFAELLFKEDTPQVVCPKLQSLVTRYPKNDDGYGGRRLPYHPPFDIAPILRRLRTHFIEITMERNAEAWTMLTHLSLQHVTFKRPYIWQSLIRGVPNLQWGYFNLLFDLPNPLHHEPSKFTLPFLLTLSITLTTYNIHEISFPRLFQNLHFPSLRDLSLYTEASPYNFPDVAMQINDGLKYVPAVRKLTLGLEFDTIEFIEFVGQNTSDWDAVEKLPTVAPHLAHLLLDISFPRKGYGDYIPLVQRVVYWKEILYPTRWLDLAKPASNIHKITAIVETPSEDGPLVESIFRNALELDKQEHRKEANDVVLEIIVGDTMKLSPDAEGWKTWGCLL